MSNNGPTPSSHVLRSEQFKESYNVVMSGIDAPSENDVLMGRGGNNNKWRGNEKLRKFAAKRCREYQYASKKGKSQISKELVEAIRRLDPPGR
jgi:hypothetical protein